MNAPRVKPTELREYRSERTYPEFIPKNGGDRATGDSTIMIGAKPPLF